MAVLFNATILDAKPRGLGIYTQNLLNHWPQDSALKVLVSGPGSQLLTAKHPQIDTPVFLQHLARLAWLETGLRKHLDSPQTLFFSPIPEAPVSINCRLGLVVHDLTALRYPNLVSHKYYFYFRHVVPRLLQRAELIVAISNSTKNDLLEFYPQLDADQIHVVHNGVDHKIFTPAANSPKVEPYFLYVGTADPHKNVETLLEAFASVSKSLPHKLVMVGPAPAKLYELLLSTHTPTERIEVLPYVSSRDLVKLYQHAAALVFPSLYEGFGLPLLEAMSCGCPVIAAETSSIPEVVGEAGILCPASQAETFAQAMTHVIEVPERQRLTKFSIARAADFSWEKTADEISALLDIRR